MLYFWKHWKIFVNQCLHAWLLFHLTALVESKHKHTSVCLMRYWLGDLLNSDTGGEHAGYMKAVNENASYFCANGIITFPHMWQYRIHSLNQDEHNIIWFFFSWIIAKFLFVLYSETDAKCEIRKTTDFVFFQSSNVHYNIYLWNWSLFLKWQEFGQKTKRKIKHIFIINSCAQFFSISVRCAFCSDPKMKSMQSFLLCSKLWHF